VHFTLDPVAVAVAGEDEGSEQVKWCRTEAGKVGLSGRTLERAAKGL
jgi:hypothetical protein